MGTRSGIIAKIGNSYETRKRKLNALVGCNAEYLYIWDGKKWKTC